MKSVLSLVLCLIASNTFAFQGDWVLTERFNKQLLLAEQGDAIAQYDVGRMYQRGRGISQDINEALRWLRRSAQQGNVSAQTSLGVLYFEGKQIKPNPKKSYSLLHSAATRDVAQAQFYLARLYETGVGTRSDMKLALRWYERAAANGYYGADDKVAALQAQLKRPASNRPKSAVRKSQPQSKSKSKSKPNKSSTALSKLLAGQWQRATKPSGYLPSAITRCSTVENNKALKCTSENQTRKTLAAEITYATHAHLDGFGANGDFKLSYVNEIAEVRVLETGSAEDEEAGLKVTVKAGDKSKAHSLVCRLESDKKLVCVRNQVQNLTFTTP